MKKREKVVHPKMTYEELEDKVIALLIENQFKDSMLKQYSCELSVKVFNTPSEEVEKRLEIKEKISKIQEALEVKGVDHLSRLRHAENQLNNLIFLQHGRNYDDDEAERKLHSCAERCRKLEDELFSVRSALGLAKDELLGNNKVYIYDPMLGREQFNTLYSGHAVSLFVRDIHDLLFEADSERFQKLWERCFAALMSRYKLTLGEIQCIGVYNDLLIRAFEGLPLWGEVSYLEWRRYYNYKEV